MKPMKYTQDIFDSVCHRIAKGESLRKICSAKDMPCTDTILKRLREDSDYAAQYTRAREDQAEHYLGEIIEICDDEEDVSRARLKVDTRKWVMGKLKPKKYADKTTHAGDPDNPVVFTGIDVSFVSNGKPES